MPKGLVFTNDFLKAILNATAIANLLDNAASSPATSLYIALHTANPASGDQTTSEATYTSYARVAVARSTSGWTASSAQFSALVAACTFPAGTGGSGTVTYFSIGLNASGASKILWSGTVTPNIVTGSGVTPQLTTGTTVTEA